MPPWASGVMVIRASEAPGAAYDLVEEGSNGFRVPVEDVHALRATLTRVAADPAWQTYMEEVFAMDALVAQEIKILRPAPGSPSWR